MTRRVWIAVATAVVVTLALAFRIAAPVELPLRDAALRRRPRAAGRQPPLAFFERDSTPGLLAQ